MHCANVDFRTVLFAGLSGGISPYLPKHSALL
jgi:hypothetical protein